MTHGMLHEALSNGPALSVLVNGFTVLSSKSFFNIMAGKALPFAAHTFYKKVYVKLYQF